jgi:hypothetical protein
MRRVNGWLTIVWVAMIPVSLYTGWVKSVVYVSALSLWALVSGHSSAWQAARVEVNQMAEMRAHEKEDLEGDVVARVIEQPTSGRRDARRRYLIGRCGLLSARGHGSRQQQGAFGDRIRS